MLTTPNHVANPIILNERFHADHQESKQFFENEIIHTILRLVARSYTVQISIEKQDIVVINKRSLLEIAIFKVKNCLTEYNFFHGSHCSYWQNLHHDKSVKSAIKAGMSKPQAII
nr:hypothetical protein [Candidatus Enterovibrio luxaltus]